MKKVAILLAIFLALGFSIPKNQILTLDDENKQIIETNKTNSRKLKSLDERILELELTKENLLIVLNYYDVKFPEIVFKQAVLESGHFKSQLCKINNNLFGMYHPRNRRTVSTERGKNGYAKYSHWTKSVEDYKLWQDLVEVNENTDYFSYLKKRGYSVYDGYVARLNTIEMPSI